MTNKANIEIKSRWIQEPPEKVRLMYEAVCAMIRERVEIQNVKVQDITSRAGIGKGTAYEYFSSKEEIVLHAVLYEYHRKTAELAQKAFAPENFRDRFYTILDWLKENREYNRLFSMTMQGIFNELSCTAEKNSTEDEPDAFEKQAALFVFDMIGRFMDYGLKQGVFTEQDPGHQTLALFSALMEYLLVITSPAGSPLYSSGEDEARSFIYRSMVAALSV